jgi:type I restriction enzyme S subunit
MRITNVQQGYIAKNNPKFIQVDNTSKIAKFILSAGDILLSLTGDVGRVGIINEEHLPAVLNQRVARVVNKDTNLLDTRYLFHFLNSKIFRQQVESFAHGAAQANVSTKDISQIAMQVPPLAEQQRIVAKLDTAFAEIDKAIDANFRNIVNTNKLFEEHRNNIYEALLQNSKVTKVKEIANLSRGHNPPKSSFINEPRDGYVRFYQIRDAKSDKFATYVPNSDKLHLVNEKEFLMNAYRHIGEVFRGVNGAFNVALCKLTIKDFNKVCEDYLYYMIPSNLIKGELLKLSERSLIPSMSVKELAELNVPLPSFNKQEEVARNIENLKSLTQTLNSIYQQKHAYFENLKSAVLAKELQSEAA